MEKNTLPDFIPFMDFQHLASVVREGKGNISIVCRIPVVV